MKWVYYTGNIIQVSINWMAEAGIPLMHGYDSRNECILAAIKLKNDTALSAMLEASRLRRLMEDESVRVEE
jgi:hypothetical protein